MGALEVPQFHLQRVQNSGSFLSRARRMGGARGDRGTQSSGCQQDPRKSEQSWHLLVRGALTPADVSLTLRFPKIFDKQSLFCTCNPTSSGEPPSVWQGADLSFLPKTQGSSWIPPIISISIAGTIPLKLVGKMQAWIRWSQGDWTLYSATLSALESVGNTSNTWNQVGKGLLTLGGWLLAIPYTSSSALCSLQSF